MSDDGPDTGYSQTDNRSDEPTEAPEDKYNALRDAIVDLGRWMYANGLGEIDVRDWLHDMTSDARSEAEGILRRERT